MADQDASASASTDTTPATSEALLAACKEGQFAEVKRLFAELGPEVAAHAVDEDGGNCLAIACGCGQGLEIAKWLHGQGVPLDQRTSFGSLATHYAAQAGDVALLEWLHAVHKLPLGTKASNGYTELHFACSKGHAQVAEWLHKHCPELDCDDRDRKGNRPLKFAIMAKDTQLAAFLLREGASPTGPCGSGADRNIEPIHLAAARGVLGIAQLLHEQYGVPVDTPVVDRMNPNILPLHLACQEGHLDVAKWLHSQAPSTLKARSCPPSNMQPIHHACVKGHTHIVRWLHEQGADIRAVDGNGNEPIHMAAQGSHMELLAWLHDQGVPLDTEIVQMGMASAPIHIACAAGQPAAVRWLADKGVSLSARTSRGQNCAHFACMRGTPGNLEVLDFLHAQGLTFDTKDDNGNSPYMLAARTRNIAGIQRLEQLARQKPKP